VAAHAGMAGTYEDNWDQERPRGYVVGNVRITGETQASLGGTPKRGAIWKAANVDLNEENWRTLSDAAPFNQRANTFDPRIYDRLRVNLDSENKEGFNFHSNLTIDPWNFTAKSDTFTIGGTGTTDLAQLELKYWSNTGYTLNQNVYTLRDGASISIPEMKVKNNKVASQQLESTWTAPWPAAFFTMPETKVYRQFMPLREFWVDYAQPESFKVRFFPMAYQDQALTFDDPLKLSNNHMWWEPSPWISQWSPGNLNVGVAPVDFRRGKIDDTLSYVTRDSDGTRLTALRGMAFNLTPVEGLSIDTTLASPKGLWQDYDSFDNAIAAARIKYRLLDNLILGTSYGFRIGFNQERNYDKDMYNHVVGFDVGYEVIEGVKISLETAASKTRQDLTSGGYDTQSRGYAYLFSVVGSFPRRSLIDLKYGYDEMKADKADAYYHKYKFYAARMDRGFDTALSNYTETRDDSFWGRHLHFRKPFSYYFSGLSAPSLGWEDIQTYKIGNGIDTGRSVLGFRLESSLWNKRFENLFDVRNVHRSNGKFIENVARDEITWQATDKLTAKFLALYHRLPKTVAGFDPFIVDADTGEPVINADILDGMNPTLKTGSIGLEYAFTDWIALSGIWERTNDSTLAYDNFPRGNLNSTTFTTYSEYGNVFRREDIFLYNQDLFPLPPYRFYNIWKSGLRINPIENMEIYIDYTRNEFKSAGQIDDNINHIGFETSYMPTKKIGLNFKYTYSRWNDLTRMLTGAYDKIYLGHHNVFVEFRYFPSQYDELVLQYGESGRAPIATVAFDPFGGGSPVLDTQHIVRGYYRRKF
jgi:hypothetical protein